MFAPLGRVRECHRRCRPIAYRVSRFRLRVGWELGAGAGRRKRIRFTNRHIIGRFLHVVQLPATSYTVGMDLRSGPPPPPRGKRAVPPYQDNHRMEPTAGAGYHVPRRLGEREPDRNHNHPEDGATSRAEFAPRNILADTPETTVGEHVHVKGELSFERLLRVDGSFKGTLTSTGDLVIGASGVVRGNISDLREIVSDGKIIGNIQAERVRLRRSAIVVGSVTCLSLSMDPDVSISGRLNVHKDAPLKLVLEGEEAPEDEVADSNESVRLPDSNKSADSEKHSSKSGGGSGRKEGSSKKESSGADGERRQKDDKGKDESRKKTKEGGSGESSKSKTSSK